MAKRKADKKPKARGPRRKRKATKKRAAGGRKPASKKPEAVATDDGMPGEWAPGGARYREALRAFVVLKGAELSGGWVPDDHGGRRRPTRAEEREANRYFDEYLRPAALRLTKKQYVQLCGRQHKVVAEQAERNRLPLRGDAVDLAEAVPALHDAIGRLNQRLARLGVAVQGDDALLDGPPGEWLEKYRRERTLLSRLLREEKEGTLIRREDNQLLLGRQAAILRGACERLERHHGAAAADVLRDALQRCEQEAGRMFGDENGKQHKKDEKTSATGNTAED